MINGKTYGFFEGGVEIVSKWVSFEQVGGGDGSFAVATTLAGATLAHGWNVAFGKPTFWGEVAMGIATLAYGTYIYYSLPKRIEL